MAIITSELGGRYQLLDPSYPTYVTFSGVSFPSALHAIYYAVLDDGYSRQMIPDLDLDELKSMEQQMISRLPEIDMDVLIDYLIDIFINKYSNTSAQTELMQIMDDEDTYYYIDNSGILGKFSEDHEIGLNLVGTITSAIRKYGNSYSSIKSAIQATL